jgi:hypothetical protein
LVLVSLGGCSLFQPAVASDWPGRSETLTALAPIQPAADTQTPASILNTEIPETTPAITEAPQVTSAPPTTPPLPGATQSPCYQAELVKDVTIPDGTIITPGKQFNKTWQLWNTGSCDWPGSMLVVFDSGTQLSANLEYKIDKVVPSGKIVDVSIPMTAPLTAGEYTSNWRLKPSGGVPFGVGAGKVPFYVKIIVGDSIFKVTNVAISVNNSNASASCPPGFTFQYTAQITANGPGEVIYRWVFGDSSSQDENIVFSGAGTQTVSTSKTISTSTTETSKIYIVQPNQETFQPGVSYSMTCR